MLDDRQDQLQLRQQDIRYPASSNGDDFLDTSVGEDRQV